MTTSTHARLAIGCGYLLMASSLTASASALPGLADAFIRKFNEGMDALTEEKSTQRQFISGMPDLASGTSRALRGDALATHLKSKVTIEHVVSHRSQAQPDRRDLLGKLSKKLSKAPTITLATTSAKAFGKEFLIGAKRGQTHLEALDTQLAPLVAPWLDTPLSKRIFVIASSSNEAEVKQLRAALGPSGYQVFFYKFCEPVLLRLCASEDVGAFFATAGHVIAFQSAASRQSTYITLERASVYKHAEGGVLIVFTPEDILKLARASSIGLHVATYALEARDQKNKKAKTPQSGVKRQGEGARAPSRQR